MSPKEIRRPLEWHWRRYRETALPKAVAPLYYRTARMAFYASASAILAEAVGRGGPDPERIELMADELKEFTLEMAREAGLSG